MPDLEIKEIEKGLPGITPTAAGQLSEACMVCLHRSNHPENVTMTLTGDFNKDYNIIWEDSFNEQIDRTYKIKNIPQNMELYAYQLYLQ